MLTMTLEQGQHVFLKALAGNNFSIESIRAYSADITQFVEFLKSLRVDWNNPQKITRLDIVEWLLLDSRGVEVPTASNATCVMLSSLKSFFFNSLKNES
jgi:site-specific recombinase XerD